MRLSGQIRAIPGGALGWDMGAALALGAALGVHPLFAAEILPEIEPIAIRALNEAIKLE